MFCSVFPSGSDETIVRLKRSSGVILAIFGHFCKIEKARIGAISWTEISSVWSPLSMIKKLARWHPMQTSYLRFKFYGNIASHNLWPTSLQISEPSMSVTVLKMSPTSTFFKLKRFESKMKSLKVKSGNHWKYGWLFRFFRHHPNCQTCGTSTCHHHWFYICIQRYIDRHGSTDKWNFWWSNIGSKIIYFCY